MDFSGTNLQSILNSSLRHQNIKLVMTISKAEELISIVSNTFRNDPYMKLVIDNTNNLIITSETSKILSHVKLVHPIQFLFKDALAKMSRFGDGNTFLILFMGNLLKECKDLLINGMKPRQIVKALRIVKKESMKIMDRLKMKQDVDFSDECMLSEVLRPIVKNGILVSLLSKAVVESSFVNPDDIRIQKIPTGCLEDSYVIRGMILEKSVRGLVKKCKGKVAIFNTSLDIERTETKSTLLFEKAEDMLNFSRDEEMGIRCLVDSICENANLVVCSGSVKEQFAEFFDEHRVMVVKVESKFDIRRIMRMTRGCILQSIRKPRREEVGEIDCVSVVYENGKPYVKFEKKDSNIVSIVLKDGISSNLDEYEVLLEKGIKALENLREDDLYFVEGGGTFEKMLSDELKELSAITNDTSKLVFDGFIKALSCFYPLDKTHGLKDIYDVKRHALECAVDLTSEILITDDYLADKGNMKNEQ